MMTATMVVSALAASLALALVLEVILISSSSHLGLMDLPNTRSSHSTPTPRIGGVGLWMPVVAIGSTLTIAAPRTDPQAAHQVWAVVLGCALVGIVGLLDDVRPRGLSPRAKYAGQLLAAVAVSIGAFAPNRGLFEGAAGWAALALVFMIQVIWLTGLTNLVNFMDGVDGMVGGAGVVITGSFALLLASRGMFLAATVALVCYSALCGFLIFNLPPARIFMGDTGSLFLGLFWGALGLMLSQSFAPTNSSWPPPLGWSQSRGFLVTLLVTCPMWLDPTVSLAVRIVRRRPLAEAHRDHLYQRMVRRGSSHWRVSLLYSAFALVCSCIAFLSLAEPLLALPLGLAALGFAIGCVLFAHRVDWAVSPWAGAEGTQSAA